MVPETTALSPELQVLLNLLNYSIIDSLKCKGKNEGFFLTVFLRSLTSLVVSHKIGSKVTPIFYLEMRDFMLIKNGTILSPATHKQQKADLRIENDRITEIGTLSPKHGEHILNAEHCFIAPGLIDVHVHFRDPGQTWK